MSSTTNPRDLHKCAGILRAQENGGHAFRSLIAASKLHRYILKFNVNIEIHIAGTPLTLFNLGLMTQDYPEKVIDNALSRDYLNYYAENGRMTQLMFYAQFLFAKSSRLIIMNNIARC